MNDRGNIADLSESLLASMQAYVELEKLIPQRLLARGVWPSSEKTATAVVQTQLHGSHVTPSELRQMVRYFSTIVSDCITAIISPALVCIDACKSSTKGAQSFASMVNALRYITERYAVLLLAQKELQGKFPGQNGIKPNRASAFSYLETLHATSREYLISTTLDWHSLYKKPFPEIEETEVKYKEPVEEDAKLQVSFRVKRLGKRIEAASRYHVGLNRFYFFCGEFAHPGIGDGFASQLHATTRRARDDAILVLRRFQLQLPPAFSSETVRFGDEKIIMNFLEFATGVVVALTDTSR